MNTYRLKTQFLGKRLLVVFFVHVMFLSQAQCPMPSYFNVAVVGSEAFYAGFPNPAAARTYMTEKTNVAISQLESAFSGANFNIKFKVFFVPNWMASNYASTQDPHAYALSVKNAFSSTYPCANPDALLNFIPPQYFYGHANPFSDVATIANPTIHTIAHEIGHIMDMEHCIEGSPSSLMNPLFNPVNLVNLTSCETNQFGTITGGQTANCQKWKNAQSVLPSDFICPDPPMLSIDSDQPFLIKGCTPDRAQPMFSISVTGGSGSLTGAKLKVRYNKEVYDFNPTDNSGLNENNLDFVSETPINSDVNEIEMSATNTFDLAPNEIKTFFLKLSFNPDATTVINATTFINGRVLKNTGGLAVEKQVSFHAISPITDNPVTHLTTNIQQPFLVTQNTTFNMPDNYNINTPLVMVMPGVKIYAQGNVVFKPSAHTVFEGCSGMWEGISVSSSDKLTLKNATIKDAQNGISVSSTFSGTLKVENTLFRNNNIGIHLLANPSLPSLIPNIILNGNRFDFNEFRPSYSGQLPMPLGRSFAGIYAKNLKGGLTIGSSGVDSYFSGLKFGIVTENTAVTVRNTTFDNIIEEPIGAGYPSLSLGNKSGKAIFTKGKTLSVVGNALSTGGASVVTMSQCHTGVETLYGSALVKGCVMTDVNAGIKATGSGLQKIEIMYNDIKAKNIGISTSFSAGAGGLKVDWNQVKVQGADAGMGIYIGGTDLFPQHNGSVQQNTVTTTAQGQTGIALGTAYAIKAQYNTVNLSDSGFGIKSEGGDQNQFLCNTVNGTQKKGIGLYTIHASRPQVSCNTTTNLGAGLQFEGMLVGKYAADIAGNTMNADKIGLLLGTDAIIGEQKHRGNRWTGAGLSQAIHLSPEVAQLSKFTVDAAENADFVPDISEPIPWFELESTAALTFQCGNSCNVVSPPLVTTTAALDKRIAKGELPATQYGALNNWLTQRRLLERVSTEGNPYPNDTDVNAFIAASQTNGLSAYANLQIGQRGLFSISSTDGIALLGQEQIVFDQMDAIANLSQQLQASGLGYLDSINLETQRTFLRNQLVQNTDAYDQTMSSMQAIRTNAALGLMVQNTLLPGSATYQAYERSINAIWLETIAQGHLNFTPAQVNELTLIANTCPLLDGEAVLRARAMLQSATTQPLSFDDIAGCANKRPTERDNNPLGQIIGLQVYPNPATDILMVVLPDNREEKYQIRFTNMLGQAVYQASYPSGLVSIDLAHWIEGIYTCSIRDGKGNYQTNKIVIQY